MTTKKGDLLLHPVRLRLMTELAGKHLTPKQLAAALPDIPQASLYRHLNLLLDNSIIEVVGEQMVNGAMERTYQVVPGEEHLSSDDAEPISSEDHIRYFNIYAAALIETFTSFINNQNESSNMAEAGLSYNRAVIYLSDEERAEFQQSIMALLGQVMSNAPTEERKRYTLASVVIPDERGNT